MKLTKVYARFYKSFNYDALKKAHPKYTPEPWDEFRGEKYPYIQVPIEGSITTIVGANESGKSQLLTAITKAITGDNIEQRDLCRYSPFFSVALGEECWPHLGVQWDDITEKEMAALRKQLDGAPDSFRRLLMFRERPDALAVYIKNGSGEPFVQHLEGSAAEKFGQSEFPQPFEIEPKIALPGSLPLFWLGNESSSGSAPLTRKDRHNAINAFGKLEQHWTDDAAAFQANAAKLHKELVPLVGTKARRSRGAELADTASLNLARDLLIRLANIDPAKLNDLISAVRDGHEGHANALVGRINEQLEKRLNFKKWWVQDRDFSLRVTLREMELVFTIQDRTGTEYTFDERSAGLKYFLSYLVQSQSLSRTKDVPQILLMDEPDTYLSAEAQQDLLKIFHDFAYPEADVAPIQVVFVTHSPFLIDKNHAERIRVLEKGKGLDGTRVIRNVSQNHYEPLRSAFGAYVGETAFIGACNLLVEGAADQILLSGVSRLLRRDGSGVAESETLDLNGLVIVPCGSASQVPYMLYLVRGRDTEKPPVIILLDSDGGGNTAAKQMRKGYPKMSRLIRNSYILQIAELDLGIAGGQPVQELEDLLPMPLGLAAANAFLAEIGKFSESEFGPLNMDTVTKALADGKGVFDALETAAKELGVELEKIGFARAVLEVCRAPVGDDVSAAVAMFFTRMRKLFSALNERRRDAERENAQTKIGERVERHCQLFVQDHPHQATKDRALILFEDIMKVLDSSLEAERVRLDAAQIKRDFDLDGKRDEQVPQFPKFVLAITALKDAFAISRVDIGTTDTTEFPEAVNSKAGQAAARLHSELAE